MQGEHAAKTPFVDTPAGSSYRQTRPNCRRTPPAKAPVRIMYRTHARGVSHDETAQQKGSKCCQMGQLAGRCARAWMACHQTQVLGRPHTPRPISLGDQTPCLKSQAVEPTKKLLMDEGKIRVCLRATLSKQDNQGMHKTNTHQEYLARKSWK